MRAIVREEGGPRLARVPEPVPAADEVVIDVAFAGVCRSDLAAADGAIAVSPGRVLGHELAGRVRALGAAVRGLAAGDPVTAIPFSPCGACAACAAGRRCVAPRWLGVDEDGAFAERVRVPAAAVVPLPPGLPLLRGAYVEPVAAALGALPFVERGARVLVAGAGRIAELTARVLAAHGAIVARRGGVDGDGSGSGFDVAIEHDGDPARLLPLLASGGTLILKSRARRAIALDIGELVARDLVVRGASHGSFAAAIDWLHSGAIAIDDLLAPPRPLEAFAEVLAAARAGESHKQMFAIEPGVERD
ncbi:MAG TPA: alcohol dehydrogenase catalytic domain-containing protein [Kofleriaceae bacterium]|nr:alcohol dehydrogenase catalytic domain-containing protein [Kofleriaceae bacterium]